MLDAAMRAEGADTFGTRPFAMGGESFVLDRSGALYWPERKTLIAADLHFEKGSSYARRGQFLPPYDTRETLSRLASVITRYEVRTFIALGDSLHDRKAHERVMPDDLAALRELQTGRDWIWLSGNHDPELDASLAGEVMGTVELGRITLRHEPSNGLAGHEIAGHLHPAARLLRHGCTIRRPCFFGTRQRLIMPAFGAFTGGLNILDPAFGMVHGGAEDASVFMLGRDGLYPVPMKSLCAD